VIDWIVAETIRTGNRPLAISQALENGLLEGDGEEVGPRLAGVPEKDGPMEISEDWETERKYVAMGPG
jgi:hypothetical protein